jgi:GTP cyclohydrolase II
MRFQALMPDVLHWLGIQKIDRMMVKYNITTHRVFTNIFFLCINSLCPTW